MRKAIVDPSSFLFVINMIYVFVKPFYSFKQARRQQRREWLS